MLLVTLVPVLVVSAFYLYSYDKSFKLSSNTLAHLILIDNPEHNLKGDFLLDGTDEKYTFPCPRNNAQFTCHRLYPNHANGKS